MGPSRRSPRTTKAAGSTAPMIWCTPPMGASTSQIRSVALSPWALLERCSWDDDDSFLTACVCSHTG